MDSTTDGNTIRPTLKARPGRILADVTGPSARDVRVFFSDEDVGLGPSITKEMKAHESVVVTAKLAEHTCRAEPQRIRVLPDQTVRTTIRCEAGREPVARKGTPKNGNGGDRGGGDPNPPPTKVKIREPKESAIAAGTDGCRPTPGLAPGYATIASKPYADIFIGTRKIGETPLSRHKLPAGCVEVRAVTKDGRSRTEKLMIEPNKVSIFTIEIK
jgi:hypothetical protein